MAGIKTFPDTLFSRPEFAAKYSINELLGQGGFGAVYKATQLSTGQDVAIKVMRPEPDSDDGSVIERFRREMRVCAQFNHPNIVRLVDSGHEFDEGLFTVFEFVPGYTLHKWSGAHGRISPETARELLLQVLDALACAHEKGVLHRDLKPDNIMITETYRGYHVRLLDFGISTLFGEAASDLSRLTATKSFVGTYAYTSPEHLHGNDLTSASDLYSWGLIFLECLQGRRVMAGETVAKLFFEQMSDQPVTIPEWLQQHALGDLLASVLAKNPADRQGSAAEVAQRLAAIDLSDLELPALSDAERVTKAAGSKYEDSIRKSFANNSSFSSSVNQDTHNSSSQNHAAQHSSNAPSASAQGADSNSSSSNHQAPRTVAGGMPPPQSGQYTRNEAHSDLSTVQADLARLRQQQSILSRRRDAMKALSLRLRKSHGRSLAESLQDITASAAEILGVARASIWALGEDRKSIKCLNLYEHAVRQHSSGGVLEEQHYPSYFEAVNEELVIAADDVFMHSSTRELLDYCSSLGIASMLDAPIWVGGRMYGVLCHEHVGTMRTWTEDECSLAASLADTASLALAAHQRSALESALTSVRFD